MENRIWNAHPRNFTRIYDLFDPASIIKLCGYKVIDPSPNWTERHTRKSKRPAPRKVISNVDPISAAEYPNTAADDSTAAAAPPFSAQPEDETSIPATKSSVIDIKTLVQLEFEAGKSSTRATTTADVTPPSNQPEGDIGKLSIPATTSAPRSGKSKAAPPSEPTTTSSKLKRPRSTEKSESSSSKDSKRARQDSPNKKSNSPGETSKQNLEHLHSA
ncbi:uncharacterized protein PAC_06991 [Phialocephala subalpina]|uniref:Uncharacterized protein n=1 Tax=Phialocephala subalpina TaxID=576137 RepID=A0A1L7WWE5_9HELO|nr:uncharacterized protein PAC_06991 [Phialocephala subalpina]